MGSDIDEGPGSWPWKMRWKPGISRRPGATPQEQSGGHASTTAATSLTAKWPPFGDTASIVRAPVCGDFGCLLATPSQGATGDNPLALGEKSYNEKQHLALAFQPKSALKEEAHQHKFRAGIRKGIGRQRAPQLSAVPTEPVPQSS